jgi:hypothetical protein
MWNPASPTRNALAFLMAAGVAFLGSATMLQAGRGFPMLTGESAIGQPGMLLLAIVILLGASGVLLVAMAVKEFVDLRRREAGAR